MQSVLPKTFLELAGSIPLIDVRSPSEFLEGHIPGAINIPLFTNEERSLIGTLYVKEGKTKAVLKGLGIVGPKMEHMADQALKIATNNELLVHCWRGGMRSESMCWLFERVGLRCTMLTGGYKNYRNTLLESFSRIENLVVLQGFTGSGKTEILKSLKGKGEQVLDLEAYAHHKGSVFGGIGQLPQPTTQQFQNNLFSELFGFDLSRRIWVEGESKTIGKVMLPDPLWNLMNQCKNLEVVIPKSLRIARLIEEYGSLPAREMEQAIGGLQKRLGGDRCQNIISLYQNGDLETVASMLLDYYDKSYSYSQVMNKKGTITIPVTNGDPDQIAAKLLSEF